MLEISNPAIESRVVNEAVNLGLTGDRCICSASRNGTFSTPSGGAEMLWITTSNPR
jgi:hypothetical protein